MAYADVDPVSGHLRAPTANAGGIEQMIRNQSIQVQVVDWIFQKITGKSLIQTIITPITGDWSRIAANGEAWRSVGSAVEAISDNLSANVDTLQQHWTGAASESFGNHIRTVWPRPGWPSSSARASRWSPTSPSSCARRRWTCWRSWSTS
jgi:hypothetical protein